jgi:GNAT superfamily N-acetyltransferase
MREAAVLEAMVPDGPMQVTTLGLDRKDEAVDVIADAFHDYPVMRFIIREAADEYARQARQMIEYFTMARLLGGDLVVGATDADGGLIGVANITRPGERPKAPELAVLREALWRELGPDAQARYDEMVRIWQTFAVDAPQFHLNILAVRRRHQKRGAARLLLETLHDLSARASDSSGVSLTTEDPINVPFYERFGYRIVGARRVADAFTTWGFFRPDAV